MNPEVATDQWRETSSEVAFVLWRQIHCTDTSNRIFVGEQWRLVADEYRAMTRRVLRELHEEGIKLSRVKHANVNGWVWAQATARLAFRLWEAELRRAGGFVSESNALELWKEAAPAYRQKVRDACTDLAEHRYIYINCDSFRPKP